MTAAGTWAAAVRARPGPGRLLPLGTAADGAWLAESAAEPVLRRTAQEVRGVAPGRIRIAPADPDSAGASAFPPPPAAVPPGPLRIDAECEAAAVEPLPALAERLRTALFAAAVERLGLPVTVIDLRVTGLLDAVPEFGGASASSEASGARAVQPQDEIGRAAAAVPGVAHLTDALGRPVRIDESSARVACATSPGHRPVDVARAVRAAITPLLPSPVPVRIVITAVESRPAGA